MINNLKKSFLMRRCFPPHTKRHYFASACLRRARVGFAFARHILAFGRKRGLRAAVRYAMHTLWQSVHQHSAEECISPALLRDMLHVVYRNTLPTISFITIAYHKEKELPFFLEALFRQDYAGTIELIVVDDKSPDESVLVAQNVLATLQKKYPQRALEMRILHNDTNLGNCESRNRGIAAATGEILFIADANCLLNASCLSRHALALAEGPFDVVIGTLNLESGHKPPLEALAYFEQNMHRVLAHRAPQDALCPTGFVNCITHNISMRRSALPTPLFDTAFSYTAHPDSGIGWEDVEMGKRLYDRGLRMAHLPHAFTVHISHPPNTDETTKAARGLRNLHKFFEKHPDSIHVAGRWAWQTFTAFLEQPYCGKAIDDSNEDKRAVEQMLAHTPPYTRPVASSSRRLRILTYHWHTSHQYELCKLPHDFTMVRGIGLPFNQDWNEDRRPRPSNISFVDARHINEKDYDLAIVPFDENVLAPEHSHGLLPAKWGGCFAWFAQHISLPKIGLCHGSPQFYGQCQFLYSEGDCMTLREKERQDFIDATKDYKIVVCNSHEVREKWNFVRARTIWHGMDPLEFTLRPATATGILTMPLPPMITRPFYNGYFIYKAVQRLLPTDICSKHVSTPFPAQCTSSRALYARAKFCNYVDVLRQNSVYLNTTNTSPMPRSRAEAMFCGLVSVSKRNNDVDMFIKNGINGFYGDTPEELADYVTYCIRNPKAAYRIGIMGRKTACQHFGIDRYLAEWREVLQEI